MPAPEKSFVRGEWGGVRRLKNEMPGRINEPLLLSGEASPQEKDNMLALAAHDPNDRIGELVPPVIDMGVRFPGFHRQRGIEEEHPLLRPVSEIGSPQATTTKLRLDLLVHVEQ